MQIDFQHVNFSYNLKTIFRVDALKDVNLAIDTNEVTAIVGKTGSGKSTLTQLINKLLTPSDGAVKIDQFINTPKKRAHRKQLQALRSEIGFLFQFPENQLFADTVLKDVEFGIRNFHPKDQDYEKKAKAALKLVGLDESFYERSPFDLSGGEKKRVAIAGVLAYQPKVLILDEPTAGLDEMSKRELMELFKKIHQEGVGIILVTHDMDIVLKYASKVVVMDDGEIKKIGSPQAILQNEVEPYHLATPNVYHFAHQLIAQGKKIDLNRVKDVTTLVEEIKRHG
ncbi:MAG: ATP-binding cassette domain-containing protein [Bacilli bacterium]|nr:ATP-binding cassette domain-containing protein [Bacilli bacterium]